MILPILTRYATVPPTCRLRRASGRWQSDGHSDVTRPFPNCSVLAGVWTGRTGKIRVPGVRHAPGKQKEPNMRAGKKRLRMQRGRR